MTTQSDDATGGVQLRHHPQPRQQLKLMLLYHSKLRAAAEHVVRRLLKEDVSTNIKLIGNA